MVEALLKKNQEIYENVHNVDFSHTLNFLDDKNMFNFELKQAGPGFSLLAPALPWILVVEGAKYLADKADEWADDLASVWEALGEIKVIIENGADLSEWVSDNMPKIQNIIKAANKVLKKVNDEENGILIDVKWWRSEMTEIRGKGQKIFDTKWKKLRKYIGNLESEIQTLVPKIEEIVVLGTELVGDLSKATEGFEKIQDKFQQHIDDLLWLSDDISSIEQKISQQVEEIRKIYMGEKVSFYTTMVKKINDEPMKIVLDYQSMITKFSHEKNNEKKHTSEIVYCQTIYSIIEENFDISIDDMISEINSKELDWQSFREKFEKYLEIKMKEKEYEKISQEVKDKFQSWIDFLWNKWIESHQAKIKYEKDGNNDNIVIDHKLRWKYIITNFPLEWKIWYRKGNEYEEIDYWNWRIGSIVKIVDNYINVAKKEKIWF